MDNRLRTPHPQGKQGGNISQSKYETVRAAIVDALRGKVLTHSQLTDEVTDRLRSTFNGSVPWYLETVKLDLEARHIIERDTTFRPARYRISQRA